MTKTTPREELRIRTAWALQRVTELVQLGRGAGWIPGRAETPERTDVIEEAVRFAHGEAPAVCYSR